VVSGSADGTARVWDVENGDTILIPFGKTWLREVWAVAYSPDMTMLATAGHNELGDPIKIWNAKTSELVASLNGHTFGVVPMEKRLSPGQMARLRYGIPKHGT
jgi:WD40 repeat protein